VAQARMTELARRFPNAVGLELRALRLAAQELLLAQSSDWPFILRTGTSPEYARKRVKDHLLRFLSLYEQLAGGQIKESFVRKLEDTDDVFPNVDPRYWT
jgi:1,4-alpha-glucan branching enzyme